MKISQLFLENFRGFYGYNSITINDFTVFIGKNDQGKSTILEAIDIFINEGKGAVKIENDDLNIKAKSENIEEFKIGIVFESFPEELIIDEANQTRIRDEYLLNKDGKLEVWKIFKNGKLKNTFIRCNHPSNEDFIKDLLRKKIKELQDFVKKNNINCTDNRRSAELRKSIREYYEKNGGLKLEDCDIIVDSEDSKKIWDKLSNYLPVYALFHSDRKNLDQDDEIQDPLKSKIEEIFKRNDIQQKLQEIATEIDNEIRQIANSTAEKFKALNKVTPVNLEANIPDVNTLKWKDVYKGIGVYTNDGIPLNKRGSGLRRLVLVSFFLSEVERKKVDNDNHIIYAIEEPETSLHPDLQIKLINALKELPQRGNYQILLTTHSPALIRFFETQSILYIEQQNGVSKVQMWDENVANKVIENLGLLPQLGKVIICVEGTNDEHFLLNINQNINELKNIIDFNEKINSGLLSIIPMKGSNLKDWINRYALRNTNAIEFHLYDRDDNEQYKTDVDRVNKRNDGSIAILTQKREIENYIPKRLIEEEFKITLEDVENWDEEDIPKKIYGKLDSKKQEAHIKSILCGSISKKITKKDLEDLNAFDEVKSWFEKIKDICDRINSR